MERSNCTVGFYDLIWNHEETVEMSNEEVFEILEKEYPQYELYNMSVDWRKSPEYFLKCRGVHGDVLVGWE